MYNILVIEDEYLSRKVLKEIIKNHLQDEVNIYEAVNGIEAKQIIEEIKFNLVIMDVSIPAIDYIDLCKYIKSKSLPVIVTSGKYDFNIEYQVIKLKVEAYLLKPIRPKKVIENIIRYIRANEEVVIESNSIESNMQIETTKNMVNNNYIKDVINYIENNINRNITLEDAAKNVNISPHYLSKIFKKETGVNFITYLNDKRIEIAKDMLMNEDIPIANIAIDLCYSKANYFSKVFKSKVGVTPSEYRESHIKEKDICY